jgi:hypothetical protein
VTSVRSAGKLKLSFDACDHFPRHELAIGVKNEQIARLVEDDAPARPVFVFVCLQQGAEDGIDRPVASPVSPGFVMARSVGQTIAIRLGLVQRTTGGEQSRFAVRRLRHPENSKVRRLAHSCFGHAVTVPFGRAELFCRRAVRRQRLFELLFDAEGSGGGTGPEFPQRMPIALAPSDQSLMVFPALAEEGDDAGQEARRRGARRRFEDEVSALTDAASAAEKAMQVASGAT